MTTLTLTPEQTAIVRFPGGSRANLSIEARAGSAKTTTLEYLAREYPSRNILALAFNKSIKDEMTARMPQNVTAMTLHGIGLNAWRQYIGNRVTVEERKCYEILRDLIGKLEKPEADESWEDFSRTLNLVREAKAAGVHVKKTPAVKPLVLLSDFLFYHASEETTELQAELIRRTLLESWRQTLAGRIDFADMILAPATTGCSFPRYDMVLADEAQDFSALDHQLLWKIASRSQFIACGDPCQAIYGFRGADTSSMETLARRFNSETLYLTTSFRCSQAVVEAARWRAPDMNSAEWAPPGRVETLVSWVPESIDQAQSAIICRNNAPLFTLALRLLTRGIYPDLGKRDVLKNLVKKMKKLGRESTPQAEALLLVQAWEEMETKKTRDSNIVTDTAASMRAFVNQASTLGGAIEKAETLTRIFGRLRLLTGHGAKGLEFRDVYFLDQDILRTEGQDNNLRYVIQTRAKENLYYITSDSMEAEADE